MFPTLLQWQGMSARFVQPTIEAADVRHGISSSVSMSLVFSFASLLTPQDGMEESWVQSGGLVTVALILIDV
jgi:hypothetical protein